MDGALIRVARKVAEWNEKDRGGGIVEVDARKGKDSDQDQR